MLDHIITCLNSTPQTLGDARKDTPEELEERHERINTAALAAAAALLATLQQQQQEAAADTPAPAVAAPAATPTAAATSAAPATLTPMQDTLGKLQEALQAPGFWKKHLGSKSPLVRRAGYGLVTSLSGVAPQLLTSCQAAAAPVVLGALQVRCAGQRFAFKGRQHMKGALPCRVRRVCRDHAACDHFLR